MLPLPNITLIGMDCIAPWRTIKAMQYSMLQVQFADAVLITSRKALNLQWLKPIGGQGNIDRIRVVFVEQGGREDYERAIVCDLHKWFQTSHCLFQEWDSAVINPEAWTDRWMQTDYLGAPWPFNFYEQGYPPCDRWNCVGNGGFSLKSRKLCEATDAIFNAKPNQTIGKSDAWICRTHGRVLKEQGFVFAPHEAAERFCAENRFYSGQFGAHGKNTIAMNGWNWKFDWLI